MATAGTTKTVTETATITAEQTETGSPGATTGSLFSVRRTGALTTHPLAQTYAVDLDEATDDPQWGVLGNSTTNSDFTIGDNGFQVGGYSILFNRSVSPDTCVSTTGFLSDQTYSFDQMSGRDYLCIRTDAHDGNDVGVVHIRSHTPSDSTVVLDLASYTKN